MTDPSKEVIYIQFSEIGSIRKWAEYPFDDGQQYVHATALQSARAEIERLRAALAILNAAIDKARDIVPDDDEGIAARVFCHHLNQAQMDARQALEQTHGQ